MNASKLFKLALPVCAMVTYGFCKLKTKEKPVLLCSQAYEDGLVEPLLRYKKEHPDVDVISESLAHKIWKESR